MDIEFLDKVMGEKGVGRVDEFTGQLWRKWKQLRDENAISQVCSLSLINVPDAQDLDII